MSHVHEEDEHSTYPLLPERTRSSSRCCAAIIVSGLTCKTALNSEASSILASYALTRSTDVNWPDLRPSEAFLIVIFWRDGRPKETGSLASLGSEDCSTIILGLPKSMILLRSFENENGKANSVAEIATMHMSPLNRNSTEFCSSRGVLMKTAEAVNTKYRMNVAMKSA